MSSPIVPAQRPSADCDGAKYRIAFEAAHQGIAFLGLPRLEGEYMKRWRAVELRKSFHEIERFGRHLLELGGEIGCRVSADYGQGLCRLADNFDIPGLSGALGRFPELVTVIRMACKEMAEGTA